jgi:hypothetical protein
MRECACYSCIVKQNRIEYSNGYLTDMFSMVLFDVKVFGVACLM